MTGKTSLQDLLASMEPVLIDGEFAFATVDGIPDTIVPLMSFREKEGITIIADIGQLEAAGVAYSFRCRQITLNVHSSLEAVGFLAAITACLSEAGMGVNPISAFYHDHLFIAEQNAAEALARLRALSRQSGV
ncbi:MAG: ACT domain-containing protein [Rhizobiaceae bacterium]|nr:ACT domain-containing protein [Rhizobiaceae bacterium]